MLNARDLLLDLFAAHRFNVHAGQMLAVNLDRKARPLKVTHARAHPDFSDRPECSKQTCQGIRVQNSTLGMIPKLAIIIFDFVQSITRVARDKPHQDARLDMEGRAKRLLDFAA